MAVDKSGTTLVERNAATAEHDSPIKFRQMTHLNNTIEYDHRAAKRIAYSMLMRIFLLRTQLKN